jgi:hypothetical protein
MARKPTPPAVDAREAIRQSIAADIAEFRRRGGRIQVLGNTPLRKFTPTSFRSSAAQHKTPTPVPKTRAAR